MNNWHLAKVKFNEAHFPEKTITERCVLNPNYQANRGEQHDTKNAGHPLQTYVLDHKVGDYLVSWKYNYCEECQKVINKYGVLFNNADGTAYIRWFIKNGKEINRTQEKKEDAPLMRADLLNEFNSMKIGGDLDD